MVGLSIDDNLTLELSERDARMGHKAPLETLERRYARALGNYETIAQGREVIVGRRALEASAARIEEMRKRYIAVMEDAAEKIRQRYAPDWTAGHIKPIYSRQGKRPVGQISRLAYAALRKAKGPMSSSDVARVIADDLGVQLGDHRAISKIASTIQITFLKRVKEGMIELHDGRPMRWAPVPVQKRQLSAAARSLSIREKRGDALPLPRSFETAARC